MVHRPADSRLLSNLLQQEKDYLKQFNQLFTCSAACLDSFTAYAAASPPPASQVILAIAGLLAAADDALKRYALGVEQWRDVMRALKDMEDDVGNIMRDREILVTRLIKVSKSHKSNSGTFQESFLIGSSRHSSSSLSLSVTNRDCSPPTSRPVSTSFTTSTQLGAAQSELQACETLLASKESELAAKRSAAVREGFATRAKAMIQCSRVWEQIGKEILDSLDDLGIIDAHRNEQPPPPSMPRDQIGASSDLSSIGPSQSASQISYPFPEPVLNTTTTTTSPELLNPTSDMGLIVPPQIPRRHSVASTSPHSSLYHTPGTPATYKVETVTYAPAVSLVVPPTASSLPSSPKDMNTPFASTSFGIGLPPPINYGSYMEVHATMHIPAAHAISEYEMHSANVVESGERVVMGGESQSPEEVGNHLQRVSSLAAAPPESSSQQKAVPITAAGSALIEVFDEPGNNDKGEREEDDDDDEIPEDLIKEGKLAVVENPRFMSEKRKKELEKEREQGIKQPSSDEKGLQLKSEEPELEPAPEKKGLSFLQHRRTGTQDTSGRVSFAAPTLKSSPSKGGETLPHTSPSKPSRSKRFLESLKGLFGGSRPPPEAVQDSSPDSSPTRTRFRAPPPTPFPNMKFNVNHREDDSDSDEYPTTIKRRSTLQTFLWGTGDGAVLKKKAGGGGGGGVGRRWSTRTDRNIRKLSESAVGDDDDEYGPAIGVYSARGTTRTPSVAVGKSAAVSKGAARAPPTVLAPPPAAAAKAKPTTLTRRQPSVGKTQTHPTSTSNLPVENARTPSAAVGTSGSVTKGYSSDTDAVRAVRAPPTVLAPPPAAAAKAKPTTLVKRQPSVGKTQTHPPTSISNLPVENDRHQPQPSHPQPQPQPHRQHSASSSGGGAIVLTAGATQPTGTLISRPGWDAQALPTAGGGLSRNNSVLSGVDGVAGGSSSGGGAVGKKRRQTSLGHGMGSGTSLGRRSSLGSSSGHGGGEGGPEGGGGRPVVQPNPPAHSLMSIVEDVAKHNRDWNKESSRLYKNRNRIVSGGLKEGPVVGMVDVVKAPRSFGRDELAQLDPAMIKARLSEMDGSTITTATTTNLPSAAAAATGASGSDDLRGEAGVVSNQEAPPPMLNGHADGYTGGSDLSQSTTSTVHRHPPTTTSPTAQPRRRKSVRVSLQPTFSPSPPAVEYDDDNKEEQHVATKQDFHHHYTTTTTTEGSVGGGGQEQQQQSPQVHAPVPVAANSSLLLKPAPHHRQGAQAQEPVHDIWAGEESDEDDEYQNAKVLLNRAAKNEKEMKLFATRRARSR